MMSAANFRAINRFLVGLCSRNYRTLSGIDLLSKPSCRTLQQKMTTQSHSTCRHFSSTLSTSASHDGETVSPRKFNVGAFGAGRIGRMHLKNIINHQRLNLRWVVDDSPQAREATQTELFLQPTDFRGTSDIPSLLDDSSLDGVFVLTPTETHASLILQSLEKGKNVFTEKPTAETTRDINLCYSLAHAKAKHLYTGFQRRLDPVFRDVYDSVLERRAVGKVMTIKCVSRDSPKPSYEFLKNCDPSGCNILSDMAVHDIDMLVWLTKEEVPESIYVVTHAHDVVLASAGLDDTVMVVIKYKSGIIATVDVCRETTYGYDMRLEVFGSNGMVRAENPREATSVIDDDDGGKLRRLFYSFPQRFARAFELEIDHFVRCLDGEAKPLVTKDQALLTSRIIEKGVQSFREKAPVYF